MDDLDEAAKFHARSLARDGDRHVRMNFFVMSDGVEVDVKDAAFEIVVLHFLHEGELVARGACDLQRDENVVRGAALEELRERFAMHLELGGGGFAAVEGSGDGAGLAEAVHGAVTGSGAGFGVEIEDFGHGSGLRVCRVGLEKGRGDYTPPFRCQTAKSRTHFRGCGQWPEPAGARCPKRSLFPRLPGGWNSSPAARQWGRRRCGRGLCPRGRRG